MLTTLNKYALFVHSILLYLCINIRKYLQQMHIKRNYIKKEKKQYTSFQNSECSEF